MKITVFHNFIDLPTKTNLAAAEIASSVLSDSICSYPNLPTSIFIDDNLFRHTNEYEINRKL